MVNATDEDKEALAEIQKDKSKIQMNRIQSYEPETFETHQNFEIHENQENQVKENLKKNEFQFNNQTNQSEKRTTVLKPETVMTESRNDNVSFVTYQFYRGYQIRVYKLVIGWHTLECNIWF